MPVILDSVAINVESTLAFNLSVRLVDALYKAKGGSSKHGKGHLLNDPRDTTIFLCVGILFLSAVPSILLGSSLKSGLDAPRSSVGGKRSMYQDAIHSLFAMSRDAVGLFGHVLMLAFSRIAMQQVRLSRFEVDPLTAVPVAVFLYAQRIAEIMFVGIGLSCCITTFLPGIEKVLRGSPSITGSVQGLIAGSWMVQSKSTSIVEKQVKSLVVNMQRTFAETVTTIIPDAQTRKMIVLLGLCMLPSIAGSTSSPYSSYTSVTVDSVRSFLMIKGRGALQAKKRAGDWGPYASILAKIWIAGLSTAWINIAIGFILPARRTESSNASIWIRGGGIISMLQPWISVISTASLAIMTRALSPLFPGETQSFFANTI